MKKIFILFFLLSVPLFGQDQVKVDLSNPKATLYTHIYFQMPGSYDLDKASRTIRGLPRAEAKEKAEKIKEILDGNGLLINFKDVPTDPNFKDTIGIGTDKMDTNIHRYAPFPVRKPEIYLEKFGSKWYFSKETIEKVDKLHKDTFPINISFLHKKYPTLFQQTLFDVLIWKPIATLITIILCVLIYYFMEPIIYRLLKWIKRLIIRKETSEHLDAVIRELARPIVFIVILRLIKTVLPTLQLVDLNAYLITGLRVAETIFWIFIFMKILKIILNMYYETKEQSKLDRQLAPILGKLLDALVILIGFLHVLTVFGVDPKTVLTGAGIGGLAVAFAAQDSVKNFIGTIVIFLDKPFQLEDWVVIGSVEGSVEKVGFRSTRLRAADTTIYQIPNSKVVEVEINNKGMRVYRRYTTELGIRYDTPPDLIETFMEGIKEIIQLHPETKSQSYNVEFVKFADFSLNIMVNVYFQNSDWGMEQASKNILHLAILRLAASLGVEFAFPSSTLMIEQLPGQESLATSYSMDKEELEKKVADIMEKFKSTKHKFDPDRSRIPGI